ncbi:MAG TPA: hypothetical protein VGX23_05275 [Actinocrinis sp.]|nr:hypothetical protein [Actinocrinis sp.]
MPNHAEARAEENGRASIQPFFTLPRLYTRFRLLGASYLIYERWGQEPGPKMLLDLLNEGNEPAVAEYLAQLTNAYRRAMLDTALRMCPMQLVRKLYHDRAAPGGRLDYYYADRTFEVCGIPIDELAHYELVINGRQRRLDWRAILSWLAEWSRDETPQWSACTQGDPTDVNLAVPFTVFDYDTAGRNAVVGEFANFCWYTGFLGGYLVPKLNPAAFHSSPKTFEMVSLNAPVTHAINVDREGRRLSVDLTWRPVAARHSAITAYWNDLVMPVWKQLAESEDINQAVKPYLALRIIGVFNVSELDPADMLALLACLAECCADDFDAERLFLQGLS